MMKNTIDTNIELERSPGVGISLLLFLSIPAQFAFNVITTSFCYDFGVEGNTTANLQKEVIFMGTGVSA